MMNLWSGVVWAFASLATLTALYLSVRQQASVCKHRAKVPERFSSQVSLEAHQKAADYTVAKLNLAKITTLVALPLLFIWTAGGGLEWLDHEVRSWGLTGVWRGVLFMMLFFLIGMLIDLPLTLYSTFVVEARFGFNKMTPALFISDLLKQLLLLLLLGTPVAWLILTLMQSAGELWWVYAWGAWSGLILLMIWAYPTFIAPLFNKFEPLPDGEMKQTIEALLQRCGFTSNGLFVMDGSRRSSHGNAYFTGLGNAKRIVFFDTLLKQLSASEVEAVLAHELGHFSHGHVKKQLVISIAIFLIGFAILGWLSQKDWFYHGLGVSEPSDYAALILFMLVMPAFTFLLSPLMSYFSRKNEFEADAYAVEHSSGEALASALVKMYQDNASTLTPDPLYSAWNDSHPPAPIRLRHIESLL